MRIIFAFFLCLVSSACQKRGKVTILKQWHLAPAMRTLDIAASKKLPQFKNQKEIFKYLSAGVEKGRPIIAEGCEGELAKNFQSVFNGWSMKALRGKVGEPEFADIMAPAPMKIKAKFGEHALTVCGDNLELIDANNLAMSDLRGYAGFFQRLVGSLKQPDRFESYRTALEKIVGEAVGDPVEFTRAKALQAMKASMSLIEERNHFFFREAVKRLDQNPIIVIGGLHASGLKRLFEKEGIESEVVSLPGYASKDVELFEMLEKSLEKEFSRGAVWMQVPGGFHQKKIPKSKKLTREEIATEAEWRELKRLAEKGRLDPDILLSDFDGDGIRDFTLSSNGDLVVVSAEDDDWDNDGIPNLADESWANSVFEVALARPERVNNRFNLSGLKAAELLKELNEKGVYLLEGEGMKYDLILLKVIRDVLSKAKMEDGKVRFFRLASPVVKYGKEVFFSYNPSSLTIDIYLKELMAHHDTVYKKHFSKNSQEEFLKGYFLPLLYHSIAHEIGHAMGLSYRELSRKDGWSFETTVYEGKYLKAKRLTRKAITDTVEKLKFKGRLPSSWKKEGVGKKGFLVESGIPSLYSLAKPSEWVAEKIGMCFLRLAYPDSANKEVALQYESLLGVNPLAVSKEFCRSYFLQ